VFKVVSNTGDFIWSRHARLIIRVLGHNYTQSGFGNLIRYLEVGSNNQFAPVLQGVSTKPSDTVPEGQLKYTEIHRQLFET
jgi:hypothetical protein